MIRAFLLFALAVVLTGCSSTRSTQTLGEAVSGYTYVPLDPFAVDINTRLGSLSASNSVSGISNLLKVLPDNAVRISVEQIDYKGNATYGPAGVSVKGGRYRTTVDFINADTTTIELFIARSVMLSVKVRDAKRKVIPGYAERLWLAPNQAIPRHAIIGSESYYVRRVSSHVTDEDMRKELVAIAVQDTTGQNWSLSTNEYHKYTNMITTSVGGRFSIPVYIGIGLRVSADIRTFASGINVSGLATIGAGAEAKTLSGSLVVQTLGVNGKSISAALPIQSELNQTTAQNAIVAVGAIKALLYERETVLAPRVVGLYLPFAGGKTVVNAIISELAKEPVVWRHIPPGN